MMLSRHQILSWRINTKSSRHAYDQNQHNGAITARAWQDFVERFYKDLYLQRSFSEVAQVCSIVFDGDTLAANVHWASKFRDNRRHKKPEYHMTRVMCRHIVGLSYKDFVQSLKEARNLRQYSAGQRNKVIRTFHNATDRRLDQDQAI